MTNIPEYYKEILIIDNYIISIVDMLKVTIWSSEWIDFIERKYYEQK